MSSISQRQDISDTKTISEFADIVRYQSRIRAIIRPVKGWAEKKTKTGSDKMLYGITFKLIKVEVEPVEQGFAELSSYMANDAFIDSDDDDEPVSKGKSSPVKQTVVADSSDEDEQQQIEGPKKKKQKQEEEEVR